MLPFRIMYPHIGFLVGLFRLCGFCSAAPRPRFLRLDLHIQRGTRSRRLKHYIIYIQIILINFDSIPFFEIGLSFLESLK